ncbi:uncharacterized protein LOC117902536 [Drosophila subobscura]|uniref:uncharacterized protein LOC117902536 n=1 Tax=Drosophila subobscura TaxID=7241 RepID=UPI00155A5601|nr:uncharacterized protein LOC117902536 [Drosophila subobscura]
MRFLLLLLALFVIAQQSISLGKVVQTRHTSVEEEWMDNDGYDDYSPEQEEEDEDDNDDEEQLLLLKAAENPVDEDEDSCEYSCPRYYRPVCVLRNHQLLTYATPCEYHNQLRCASVRQRQGQAVSTFQFQYNGACRQ